MAQHRGFGETKSDTGSANLSAISDILMERKVRASQAGVSQVDNPAGSSASFRQRALERRSDYHSEPRTRQRRQEAG